MSADRKLLRCGFHRKASPVPFEEPTVRSAGTNGRHYGPPVTHGVPDKKPQDVLAVPSPELGLSGLGSRMVALNVAAVGRGAESGVVAYGGGGDGVSLRVLNFIVPYPLQFAA